MKENVTYLLLIIAILLVILVFVQRYMCVNEGFSPSIWSPDTDIIIVSSHWEENLDWLTDIDKAVVVCGKEGEKTAPIESSPKCKTSNNGREASSYLKFIVNNYDNLPKYVAFIHGHESAWHQKKNILQLIAENEWKNKGYFTLNGHISGDWNSNHELWPLLYKLWPNYFKDDLKMDCPTHMEHDCCAQFIVSRDRILRHPRNVYEKWLNLALNDYKEYNIKDRDMAILFEWIWHIIFGEPVAPVPA